MVCGDNGYTECKAGVKRRRKYQRCKSEVRHLMIGDILSEKGIYPAYHMNKSYWVTVALDGSADDETVKMLTRMSFKLTEKKKRDKMELK